MPVIVLTGVAIEDVLIVVCEEVAAEEVIAFEVGTPGIAVLDDVVRVDLEHPGKESSKITKTMNDIVLSLCFISSPFFAGIS